MFYSKTFYSGAIESFKLYDILIDLTNGRKDKTEKEFLCFHLCFRLISMLYEIPSYDSKVQALFSIYSGITNESTAEMY